MFAVSVGFKCWWKTVQKQETRKLFKTGYSVTDFSLIPGEVQNKSAAIGYYYCYWILHMLKEEVWISTQYEWWSASVKIKHNIIGFVKVGGGGLNA